MADEFSQNGGSQSKLVTDQISLVQRLALAYAEVVSRTNALKQNLGGVNGFLSNSMGGGGGGNSVAAGGGTYSGGFNSSTASLVGNLVGTAASTAIGVAGSVASMLPTVQQAVSSQLLTSQAKFSGMQGNVNSTVRSLMGMGTTSSSTDVQQAISQGTANGILPGLTGYNSQIMPGVMQLSNLTGSAQSGMQAATALNSAGSVNMLRMVGIQVRGGNGAMRSPADIFKDIYNFAVAQSGGKLNASNIAIALQPGNGLANFLDAAAAGDPVLRNALQTAALQFAQGGNLSRASTTATGQTTAALNSASNYNQSQFGLLAASQTPEATGFTEANRLLSKATNSLASLVSSNAAAAAALKQLAKGETFLGSSTGRGITGMSASLLGGLIKGGSALVGGLLGEGIGALPGYAFGSAIAAGLGLGSTGGSGMGQGATVSPQTSGIQSTAAVNSIINTGASLIGTPYSWGGGNINGPTTGSSQGANTVGFDCSSFVQYVYARVGVMLPRTTYAQINCGKSVEPSKAQPGDLLFFGNAIAPDHVAIYVGGNRMLQAPHTGASIEVTSVDLNTVSAARRVVNGATGTAINGNLLNNPKQSVTSMAGNLNGILSHMVGSLTGSSGNSGINMNELMGYSPNAAMSGGATGGSGIGQGASNGVNAYSSANMAQKYFYINSKTGTLEVSTGMSGTTINYGSVTIPINVPQGQQFDEQKLAKLIKQQITSLNIHAKVAKS